ncbi:SDR family NAD(P)-dependent oxidoreductase [Colwelliaceae bacterium 6441]
MTKTASPKTSKDYSIGVFTSIFTGNEAFLADHLIQGNKILPGMAYLEISRVAIANSVMLTDEQMIVLRDNVFVNALVVTEVREVEVKVYPGVSGEFGIEVSTSQGVHFQSKAFIQERPQTPKLDITALAEKCPLDGPNKQDFYNSFKERHVNLGPSHRGIQNIKLGDKCALVRLSSPGSSSRGMGMDPGMLDSVIQGGVAVGTKGEGNVVPFAVLEVSIFDDLTDEMYAYIVKTEQGIDYIATDESGNVKVDIKGFLTREIDLNANKDQLVFYKPEWQVEPQGSIPTFQDENITVIEAKTDYAELVKSVFNVAKQLIKEKVEQHLIEVRLPEEKPQWQGIVATLKTINAEYPKISYRIKRNEKSISLSYQFTDMTKVAEYDWPENKTILMTGGLGGLGMLFAKDIASQSKDCTLILVGRSELTDVKKEFIKQLETLGATIIYECCDINNETEITRIVTQYPQISGVIHGSGIIKDNVIINKTEQEIDQVLAPKVKGLTYLDQATAHLKLDYFVVLSSIAGTLGNPGQLDYAGANGFMDAYIHHREQQVKANQRFGKSISINWPLWESGSMQIDETTKQNLLQVYKIKPLQTKEGLTALKQLIASEYQQLVVVYGNKKSIAPMFEQAVVSSVKKKPKKESNSGEMSKLSRLILQEVRLQTAEHLKLKPNQLTDTGDWAEFGFDSILMSSFVNRLNSYFTLNLMPTVLFEASNIQAFSQYLLENYREELEGKLSVKNESKTNKTAQAEIKEKPVEASIAAEDSKISAFAQGFKKSHRNSVTYQERDVAIVGISCKIAGASNLDEFWQVLDQERNMVSEIPEDRWIWQDYPGVSKWGTFIEDVDKFDSLFFGISPAEAMYMNPEQRMMMQYVWQCVEDAGCGGDEIKGNNTGLFIGCGPSGYTSILSEYPVEAFSATGTVSSVGPNRISYLMDWHGPSHPIDTACSSALVAVHRAVEVIRAGHCEQAIAGGVNLLLAPEGYISFSKSGMLCEDGRCKTFSADANGYVRGEGVGMLMLKPLQKALKDGNNIYALIKGTAENHGGRTSSLTAPNPKAQAAVIKDAVKDAGIDFSRVSYIECHGTGTSLGDPVEINGLKMVASDLLDDENSEVKCKLGSIKSNIGHLEYGAGAVGLIKVILQMKHKKIAKSLYCDKLNPYINLTGTPFEVAQSASDWHVPVGETRIAGVSSFGFGGANAHIILEEFQEINTHQNTSVQLEEEQAQLLIISAKNKESLLEYVNQFIDFIKDQDNDAETLKRIAYTLQVGRAEMQERVVFIASSIEEWSEQLKSYIKEQGNGYNRQVYRGSVKANATDNIEISDTQAGKDYVNQLIMANEAEKLAELWVKGTKIEWRNLYAETH